MATIDSLELEIQAKSDLAIKSLDGIVQRLGLVAEGISAIGKNAGLSDFAKQAREATKGLDGFRDAAKNIQSSIEPQMKKVAKSFEEITERYKDLGKGFRFEGSTSAIQKQIDKYSNSLETAKLKKQELEASGNVNGEQYEKAVRDVIKYSNIIESLKNQLKELESVKIENPIKDLSIEEFTERAKTQIQQSLDGLRIENPISVTEMSDEQLQVYKALAEEMEEARSSLSVVDEEMQKVGESAEALGGKAREAAKAITYNADAMQMVYGKENAGIQNFQQALDKFGVKTGSQLGAELSDSLNDVQKKAEILQKRLSELAVPEIKEDNLQKLESKLKKTEALTDQLRAKLSNEITMGRITESVDDKGFVRLQEQITLAEKQIEALRAKIEQQSGALSDFAQSTSNSIGIETTSAKNASQSMSGLAESKKRATNENKNLGSESESTSEKIKKENNSVDLLIKSLSKFASTVKSALVKVNSVINKALSGIGKLVKSMFLLGNSTKSSGKGFNFSLMTILKYGLGIRSLYVLFNKLRSAVKEGMENLIQYSDRTNQSVSMLKSSLNQFKNSAAAAFAPVLNAIAPILNNLIQLFIRATNAVNQFFAALTGQSTWIKAKYVYEDAAEKISGAAKAAKGVLQPFDKLNNLTSQTGTGGGGALPEDMFETKPIEDKYKNFLDWLKSMWDKADFTDLGSLLGQKLKDALDNIPWTEIKEKARKLGKSLATLINGFIEVEGLGYSIGRTLAEAINTAYEFFNTFVHELHWDSVGKFIAETINGFFQNIDWDLIYDTFTTGAKGLSNLINNFTNTLDWDAISTSVSNFFNTLIDTAYIFITETDWIALAGKMGKAMSDAFIDIDWKKAGQTVGEAFKSFFDFIAVTIENIDWWEVGESVKDFLVGIDWGGVFDSFCETIGAVWGGFAAFLGGLIVDGMDSAKQFFQDKIEEAGGDIVAGILLGIRDGLANIAEWLLKHVYEPFMEGFCNAFGIHSPSTVMAEMGKYIIQGLLSGLKATWETVSTWLQEKLQWILDKVNIIKNSFSKISGKAQSALGGISFGSGIGNLVGGAIGGRTATYNAGISTASLYNYEIPKFAKGGIVTQYTQAVVGEAGAEAIMPLTDHKAMKMIADSIMSQYQGAGAYRKEGYQTNGQGDPELKNLLRKNNELLEAILEKPVLSDKDIFEADRREFRKEEKRRYGNGGSGVPILGAN